VRVIQLQRFQPREGQGKPAVLYEQNLVSPARQAHSQVQVTPMPAGADFGVEEEEEEFHALVSQ